MWPIKISDILKYKGIAQSWPEDQTKCELTIIKEITIKLILSFQQIIERKKKKKKKKKRKRKRKENEKIDK